VISTSTNNRIPEISTGFLPLTLYRGVGLHRKHRVSMPTESEYSNLRIASIQSLAGLPPDSPDGILFRSSGGRWASPLDGTHIALQRVSLTPGLHVSDEHGNPILLRRLHELEHFSELYSEPIAARVAATAAPRAGRAIGHLADHVVSDVPFDNGFEPAADAAW
jgi:hypothetical protein